MATNVFSIGPTGDYTTITAWQSARTGVAVSGDYEVAVMLDQIYTGSWGLGLWATGVNIIVRAQNNHQGNISPNGLTGVLWRSTAGSSTVNLVASTRPYNLTLEDIVFNNYHEGNALNVEGIYGYNLTINRCIYDSLNTGNGNLSYGIRVGNTTGQTGYIEVNSSLFVGPYSALSIVPTANQKTSIEINRSTFINSRVGEFGGAGSDQRLYVSGCLIVSGSNWDMRNSATRTAYVTDCITESFGNPFDNVTKINCNTGSFVSGESHTATQVGFVDPFNENRLLRNYRLYSSDNNMAVDYATGSVFTGTDLVGNPIQDTYVDAGAFELYTESSPINVDVEPTTDDIEIDADTQSVSVIVEPETINLVVSPKVAQYNGDIQTILSYWESTYNVGRRHVDFSVRSSVVESGSITDRDAQGQWRVVRNGTIIHRENKILDFQWLGLNGDIVYVRAVDKEGNTGEWESYTFVVIDNEDADFVCYVDTSGNDTTGDGSIGSPWATVTKAVTEAQSALTSGQVGVIFLSDDQTWAHTATLYSGGDVTSRLVRFVRKGGGTNRPILTFSNNTTAFAAGKRGAFHIDGIDLDGAHTTGTGIAFSLVRSGGVAADQSPWDCMVVDCDVTDFGYGMHANYGLGSSARDEGCNDFVALQNVSFTGTREYHIYGCHYLNRFLIRSVDLNEHATAFNNPFRTFGLGRTYVEDLTFDTNDAGAMRCLVGAASGLIDAMRYVTFNRVVMYGTNPSLNGMGIAPDSGISGYGIAHDIRYVDCKGYLAGFGIPKNMAGTNGVTTERIDYLECFAANPSYVLSFGADATAGNVHNSIRIRNCVGSKQYAGSTFLYVNGPKVGFADDCFEIDGCAYLWISGNSEPRTFISADMSRTDLAASILRSSYNHIGQNGTNGVEWVRTAGDGNTALSTWQSLTSHDTGSSTTLSTEMNWTDSGLVTALNADFRLASDSGPLAGTGYALPLGVAIDRDGYLRSATTPDAGPYEYGASATPDDPSLDVSVDLEPDSITLGVSTYSHVVSIIKESTTITLEVEVKEHNVNGEARTVLEYWESQYNVGRQHVDFSIRRSMATVGRMDDRDAQGEWRVVRGGTVIHRQNKVLDFQWLGLNGDVVYVRSVDREGNAGDWESYTFNVIDNEDADMVVYVDTGGNDTTGDGTIGNPWATVTKAVAEVQSTLTTGQVGVVFLSDDQTWAHTSTLYTGGTTSCLVRFVRRGNGANKPLLTFSASTTAFAVGMRGTFHIDSIDLTGNHGLDYIDAIRITRSGGTASDRDPFNVMIYNCVMTNFGRCFGISNGVASSERDGGTFDFIAIEGCTMTGSVNYHIYGAFYIERFLIRNTTFGPHQNPFLSGPMRVWALGRTYFDDVVFDTQGVGSLRLLVGQATSSYDAMRYCTFVKVEMIGTNGSLNSIGISPDAGMSGYGIAHDIRFVDCICRAARFNIAANSAPGSNAVDSNRIDYLECSVIEGPTFSAIAPHLGAMARNIRFRNCAVTSNYAGNPFLAMDYAASGYEPRSIQIDGCWKLWNTGNQETRMLIAAAGMSNAELASLLYSCDYNHLGKLDSNWIEWVRTNQGNTNLATWQSQTTFDDNSSVTYNTSLDVTVPGFTNSGSISGDFRLLSDTGVLANNGYPLYASATDADGYIRSVLTPDAGPYEYAATGLPDDPFTSVDTEPDSFSYYINTSTGHVITVSSGLSGLYRSNYKVGIEHVHINLRRELPDREDAWKAWGEYHLYRSGVYETGIYNILDFSWPLKPGHDLYYRYAFDDGTTGNWNHVESQATYNWTYEQFVDATSGSNSNNGESPALPVQTIAQAITNAGSSMTSGSTVRIALKAGEFFDVASSSVWTGSNTDFRIFFNRYGDGSNPTIGCNSVGTTTLFNLGGRSHCIVQDIHLQAATGQVSGGNVAMSWGPGRFLDTTIDSGLDGVTSSGLYMVVSTDITGATTNDRRNGAFDYFFLNRVNNGTPVSNFWQFWGGHFLRKIALIDTTLSMRTGDAAQGPQRNYYWSDMMAHNYTLRRNQANPWRIYCSGEVDNLGENFSFSNVTISGSDNASLLSDVRFQPISTGAVLRNVRFNACRFTQDVRSDGGIDITTNEDDATWRYTDIDNITVWNSQVAWPRYTPPSFTGDTIKNFDYRNNALLNISNAAYTENAMGDGSFMARIESGTASLDSNIVFWSNKNQSRIMFFGNNVGSPEAMSGRLGYSDYNVNISRHISSTGIPVPHMRWWPDDSNPPPRFDYTYLRSEVCSIFGYDCNSVESGPDNGDFVNNGTVNTGWFNARMVAGTGVQAGAGRPRVYSIDADNYVRDPASPDAGPYEFNSIITPDLPLESSAIDVDVEPDSSSVNIDTYNNYSSIYVEDSSDEIQVEPVDPDTLIGAQPTSSNINISAYTVSAIDVTSNIYTDPDPIELLITPYIQSAENQVDIDIEPAAISEIYYNIVTPTVLANSETIYANPTGQTITYDQPAVGTISSIVYLEEDPSVIGYSISAGVDVLAGTGVVTYPGYGSLLVTVVTPVVSTTSLPGGNIPGMPVEPNANSKEYYDYEYVPNQNIDSTNLRVDDNFTTQENISNKDIDIVPILEIATNVNNDVTRLNQHLSETFIRNTIQQTTRVENKNKVRVVTANYQKFTSSTNGSASRFQIRRK